MTFNFIYLFFLKIVKKINIYNIKLMLIGDWGLGIGDWG